MRAVNAARPSPVRARRSSQTRVFEVRDWGTTSIDASLLLAGRESRDPVPQIARLADHFVRSNQRAFSAVGVTAEPSFTGSAVRLRFHGGAKIGAVPLVSPTTGRPDYGIIVRPRFPWRGIGPMLAEMGWRVIPNPLRLPLLPQSDRQIPEWVLSTVILARMRELLRQLERRFEIVDEERRAPRGTIDWKRYATRNAARARFLGVPCRFPDLRDDRRLRAAIHFTLRRLLGSLASQRENGIHVVRLMDAARSLIELVRDTEPQPPSPRELEQWLRGPLTTPPFHAGVEAMQWTVEHRGLAGMNDLRGLPWSMSMDAFFEAWTEVVAGEVARRIGGTVRTGRQEQTRTPLRWDPPYRGSLQSLLPDVILHRPGLTLIIDAKYKRHWEEFQERAWLKQADELRAEHRDDLLQVLSYAHLSGDEHTVVCLAYPCTKSTWASMRAGDRAFYRGTLNAGTRRLELVFTAFPMGVPAKEVATPLAELMRRDWWRSA